MHSTHYHMLFISWEEVEMILLGQLVTYLSGADTLDKRCDCREDGQCHHKVCEDGPDPHFGGPGDAEYGRHTVEGGGGILASILVYRVRVLQSGPYISIT